MGYNLQPHQTRKSKDHYHFNKSHKIEKRITNLSTLVWYDLVHGSDKNNPLLKILFLLPATYNTNWTSKLA